MVESSSSPKRIRGRPKLSEEEKQMRAELKDQERIRNNVEKLKKAKKEAEKVKDFVVSANDLVDMEKTT